VSGRCLARACSAVIASRWPMLHHASSSAPRFWGALALALAAALAHGCGGGSSGKLMVDSPLTPFEAPDEDDLAGDDDEDEDEPAEPAAAEAKE
jgi:hypothetical protein